MMEQNNRNAVTPEEFEAMRRRYAKELMAIRQKVDAMLDRDALLEEPDPPLPRQYDCQGTPIQPQTAERETEPSVSETRDASPLSGSMEPILDDTATVQVMVTTAQEAVPIAGAVVLISRDRTLLQAMLTDSSGKTPILTVPAPNRALTEAPGELSPFAVYRAAVTAEGFVPQINDNVTVFGGTASQLSVALQPMPQPQVPPPDSDAADGSLIF